MRAKGIVIMKSCPAAFFPPQIRPQSLPIAIKRSASVSLGSRRSSFAGFRIHHLRRRQCRDFLELTREIALGGGEIVGALQIDP